MVTWEAKFQQTVQSRRLSVQCISITVTYTVSFSKLSVEQQTQSHDESAAYSYCILWAVGLFQSQDPHYITSSIFCQKANDLEVFIIFIYLDESQNCGFSEDDVKEDTAVQSLSLSNRSFWSL